MKNSRLFEILYLLVEKRAVTAVELAQRLEVSERTIYRDIDALSAAGIPVFTQQGQGGGIRLMDQFVLDKALLSQSQQDEILFALQAVLASGGAAERETLAQLTTLFRREGRDWLEVDFTDWGSGAAERETFALVKGAVLARQPLSFTYYSSAGEKSRRTVEPARLVFKSGCWYLSAYCRTRQDWRIFRLARMEELVPEEGNCPPRNPPDRLEAPSAGRESGVDLRLRFHPAAAWRVQDYFHPRQITREPDGRLLVNCNFPADQWLLSFLLSFGSQLEVLSPGYWRDILIQEGKKFLAVYETGQAVSSLKAYPCVRGGGTDPAQHKEVFSMEERKFCQCCGMPLDKPEDAGTEADGTPSGDYCRYCYQNGTFTAPDATMDDIIAFNLKFNAENGCPMGTQEEAEKMMRGWFPTLKRWRKP
ncbi:MAG: WYL domain-containing protein [Oscillibacter sp.]|nr:WYL domain-containing protein [Oscillibacter sp.]